MDKYVNVFELVTIFVIPHLLKNTRNCLLTLNIKLEPKKLAKFKYISSIIDKTKRSYTCLPKIKDSHFNFKESYISLYIAII